jgi:hypothetical protein
MDTNAGGRRLKAVISIRLLGWNRKITCFAVFKVNVDGTGFAAG